MKKIVLTGGGTAGHVTPHIALVSLLREYEYDIHYIGTAAGIEKKLATDAGLPFHVVNAGKLRRYLDMRNVTDVARIIHGFLQSFFILMKLRPGIVFSKGGFVSCPVVWAAWLLRIPVVIHESDMTPGLANKLSLPFAKKICYSFPETAAYLKKRKAVYTGLPVRRELMQGSKEEGKRICGFGNEKPVLLVMGGSLGAQVINAAVRAVLPELLRDLNVCHICGNGNLSAEQLPGYAQFEYVTHELSHLLAVADIFTGRSGATTLFELLALRIPALYIPLATGASRGDQLLNAASFEKQGFCRVLQQKELSAETLCGGIRQLLADKPAIVEAIQKAEIPDGVAAVYEVVASLSRE